MLTISVKNFGPIAEGSVDLKPLTIFVGPSNTGKSYMATAVYAVAGAVPSFSLPFRHQSRHIRRLMRRRTRYGLFEGGEEYGKIVETLNEWILQQVREGASLPEFTVSALPGNVRSWLEKITLGQLSSFQDSVINGMRQIHGEESYFVNQRSDRRHFCLRVSGNVPLLNVEMWLNDYQKISPQFDISQVDVSPEIFDMAIRFPAFDDGDLENSEATSAWIDSVVESPLLELPDQSYYLPAARSGIVQGHKVLSAALVRQSSFVGLQELHIPTLPGITTEFLSNLISLDRRMGRREHNGKLQVAIAFIETNVLRGQIDLDESGGLPYPEIVYSHVNDFGATGKFTLEHTSSMVSELAPLVLFLKYLVRPGDLLILEEPESHLHPAAQRQLARGIVRLVNAGVKVLITTHSDIIISQVNNLLALRQASPELIESGGFEPEDFLQPDQVGAYLFRYSQELGGCETVPLEIDPDTGIDEDEFAAVFEAIYDESIALQRDRN